MKEFKNIKILYVEDDVNTNEEVSFFLAQFTDFLHVAYNGKEGLEAFKELRPQIVITDIQMPLMDGLQMIKAVKQIDKDTFFIVTTAFNEAQYLIQAINLGISKYLLKPLNLKELLLSIREISASLQHQTLYQSLDAHGNIIEVNQAWLNYLDYKQAEVIGEHFSKFIKQECVKKFEMNFADLKKHGFAKNIRFFLQKRNGKHFEVILDARALYDAKGNFERTHCELRNLDVLLHSQEEISQLLSHERYLKSLVNTHVVIMSAIANASGRDKFLDDVCNGFAQNIDYEFAFIAFLEKDATKVRIVSQSKHPRIDAVQIMGEVFEIDTTGACSTCKAIRERKMVLVDDIKKLEDFSLKNIFLEVGIKSVISIPIILKSDNRLLGAITLTFQEKHIFQKEELLLFTNISQTIGFGLAAISDKQEKEKLLKALHVQATTDALTTCANRHRGKEFLKEEIQRAKRYHRDLSLIYFDIDDFKHINDTYGHDMGDRVLMEVAKCVADCKRSSDVGVRWGGEEFLVVLPESNLEGGVIMAEKLRSAFQNIALHDAISVRASFGVAAFNGDEDWDAFVKRADNLMYKAKLTTKDRVVYE